MDDSIAPDVNVAANTPPRNLMSNRYAPAKAMLPGVRSVSTKHAGHMPATGGGAWRPPI